MAFDPLSLSLAPLANDRSTADSSLSDAPRKQERWGDRVSDVHDTGGARKKLKLTKEQSALLEDTFKEQTTLNPTQKDAMARQLNLRPRQVEVWFQNRRARTKLKQTEADHELLKACYDSLTDENRRLHRELRELRAVPMYVQMPFPATALCPTCEQIGRRPAAA